MALATDVAFKISAIVIDDGSTDGSEQWIKTNVPQVHVLRGTGNLWWSGAMNFGGRFAVECAQADYIVCWNHDILCAPEYFVKLRALLSKESCSSQLVGSAIYFLDRPNTLLSMGGRYSSRTGRLTLVGFNQEESSALSTPTEADWTGGMGTIIHRSVFETIGYWDSEVFPQTYSDCDFCLRARRAGVRLIIRPELRIWNDKTSSSIDHKGHLLPFLRSFVHLNSNYNVRTKWRFCRRHGSSWLAYGHLVVFFMRYIAGFLRDWFYGTAQAGQKRAVFRP
jgi:GT2 family glycosyltransferase